jgi:TCP-1/cpn60 chaperonin family
MMHQSTINRQLSGLKAQCTNIDQRIGIEIIEKALRAPATIIVNNAGLEGAVVVGELLKKTTPQEGFNAADCTYVDLISAGIIDPTKVCICVKCPLFVQAAVVLHFTLYNILWFAMPHVSTVANMMYNTR